MEARRIGKDVDKQRETQNRGVGEERSFEDKE